MPKVHSDRTSTSTSCLITKRASDCLKSFLPIFQNKKFVIRSLEAMPLTATLEDSFMVTGLV